MKRARNSWTAAAEAIFLDIWQERMSDLRGPRKNTHIHMEMADEMQKLGYDCSASAVNIKIDNLTAKYRKAKGAIGTTGGSPATWPLYEKVHQIIGGFTMNNVEDLVEESFEELIEFSVTPYPSSPVGSLPSSELPCSTSPDALPSGSSSAQRSPDELPSGSSGAQRSAKKKEFERLVNVCERMENNFEKAMNEFNQSNDELLELERAKVAAVQPIKEDNKRLTEGVLEFLKTYK